MADRQIIRITPSSPSYCQVRPCTSTSNRIENQIRPIAIDRKNWPVAGSLRVGKHAAAIVSLIQSARVNV